MPCRYTGHDWRVMYYYGYRYYDPVTGRWPSRDPIGEPFVFREALRREFKLNELVFNESNDLIGVDESTKLDLAGHYKAYRSLYAAHLQASYRFLSNSGIDQQDKLGLDRAIDGSISGFSFSHPHFSLDRWDVENGKYKQNGYDSWGFGPAGLVGSMFSLLVPVPGYVYLRHRSGNIPKPSKSSPCQDIAAYEKLKKYRARPPFYHVLGFNCQSFVGAAYQMGMKEPAEGKCCNPDGTKWER